MDARSACWQQLAGSGFHFEKTLFNVTGTVWYKTTTTSNREAAHYPKWPQTRECASCT